MSSPLVVGIAGGTGSVKTTVTRTLAAAMPAGRYATIELARHLLDVLLGRLGRIAFE